MKYCSKCGVQLKEDQKFCIKCGAIVKQGNITKPLAPSTKPASEPENSLILSKDNNPIDITLETNIENTPDNIDNSPAESSKPTAEPSVPEADQPVELTPDDNDSTTAEQNNKPADSTDNIPNAIPLIRELNTDNDFTQKIPTDEIRRNTRPAPPKATNKQVKNPPQKTTEKTHRHKINVLAIVLPIIIAAILIGGFFCVKAYFSYLYGPKNVIAAFKQAVEEKDAKTLSSILYNSDSNYIITESNCNSLIDYLNENPKQFSQTINDLNKDKNILKRLKSANKSLLADNELFALTTRSSNFLFTKYAVTFKPLYITMDTHGFTADIYFNDDQYITDYTKGKVGPLIPGTYDIKMVIKDSFNNDIEETKTVSVNDPNIGSPINFFSDYNTYFISTNLINAAVFINNKDTGKKFTDLNAGVVILKAGDEVYLSYTSNGATYKSAVNTCTSDNEYLSCNFSTEDYYAITNTSPTGSSPNNNNNSNSTGNTGTSSNGGSNISDSLNSIINKYSARDYIISNSGTDKLTFRDLLPYSVQELYLAKYEIYARHGYKFTSQPNLQKFFEHKSWYHPDNQYYGDLSDIEKENYDSIRSLEFLKMAIIACPEISADYVLPNSNTAVYSKDDINALNDWELIIARNELFARYGFEFSTEELVKYFNNKSWYYPDPSVNNSIELNSCENDNLSIILEIENARAAAATSHDLQ